MKPAYHWCIRLVTALAHLYNYVADSSIHYHHHLTSNLSSLPVRSLRLHPYDVAQIASTAIIHSRSCTDLVVFFISVYTSYLSMAYQFGRGKSYGKANESKGPPKKPTFAPKATGKLNAWTGPTAGMRSAARGRLLPTSAKAKSSPLNPNQAVVTKQTLVAQQLEPSEPEQVVDGKGFNFLGLPGVSSLCWLTLVLSQLTLCRSFVIKSTIIWSRLATSKLNGLLEVKISPIPSRMTRHGNELSNP